MMPIEVELKFPLTGGAPTVAEIIEQLEAIGGQAQPSRQQRDHYYTHPGRDFGETDEALRIREDNDQLRLTYKGPLMDDVAKTRLELETGIESAEIADGILVALGFRLLRTVSKQRRPFGVRWRNLPVEVVIDQVEGLGEFVELETISDVDGHQSARDHLLDLATTMGLTDSEQRSYLGLLLLADPPRDD
tara:strand:+ start:898 stop:1467 length:570 start_codon:yes stop_codon:yes gene_type:complete